MRRCSKRLVSAGLSFALLAGAPLASLQIFSAKGLEQVQAASAVTRSSIHDGSILHAFAWNFNTIKENMADIAEAGYTAVQTSPINECLSTEPGLTLFSDEGKWYYHYQPTDWVIGNYQLGTRDEFKAMCEEADKYGIGIIVDIDPNHTTPLFNELGDGLLDAVGGIDNLYHIDGDDVSRNMNYSDRISTTYDPMGGLPDVDTENEAFQSYFYGFLKDCVDCGADGFRIDTAKHIALPDDGVPATYAGEEDRNDFYPNMKDYLDEYGSKDYADLFVYGEVLQGDTARLAAYQDMLGGTTASDYGGAIRTAISSGNLAASKIDGYRISDDVNGDKTYPADSDKLVTWVESHDNYINDKSYNVVDDTDVILAWAIITAREDGTPLFFSRPNNSSADNIWGDNILGAAGSDIYKDPQVAAVNKFRTAMVGEPETLRNANGNNSILMIERGNKGVVIVNSSEADMDLDTETGIADGTYIDSVEGSDALFNVKDGKITGTVKAQSVVVLDKIADGDYSTLFFFNSKNWSDISAVVDNNSYDCRNTGDGWWTVTIPSKEYKVAFTDGVNTTGEYTISPTSGNYMTAEDLRVFASKEEAEKAVGIITKSVYFFNTVDWSTVYAYAWTDTTEYFGGWTGVSAKNEGGYWWRADVKMMSDAPFEIIFNNGNGQQTENINMSDSANPYVVVSNTQPGGNLVTEKYSSKDEAMNAIGKYSDKTTVYFYNTRGWEQVSVYAWGEASLGDWPGTVAEYDGDNWWKLTINAAPSADFNIIFNDNGVGSQTGNLVVDNIANVYFWGDKKYSSKAAAEKAAYEYEHAEPGEIEEVEGYTTIYYYDENQWNDVYVYAWGGNYNNCIGDWPGTKMTRLEKGWYAANVLTEALNNTDLHLIFNNGNGTQLDDNVVSGTFSRYFTSSSRDSFVSKSEVYDYLGIQEPSEDEPVIDEPTTDEPAVDNPSDKRPIDEEPAVEDGYKKLYIKLDEAMFANEAYVYAWTDGENHEYFGSWPGKKMQHIGNNWYSVNAPIEMFENETEEDVLFEGEDILEENVDRKVEEAEADVENTDDAKADATEEVVNENPKTEEASDEKESVVEENAEDDSVLDELKETITSFIELIVSAFSPMEVQAEESSVFVDGLHLIVNSSTDQINDVQARFTLERPSAEELKQTEEVKPEPEKPVEEVKEPTVAPENPTAESGKTENNSAGTSSSGAAASAGASNSASTVKTAASTAATTIAEAQVPTAAVNVAEKSQKKVAVKTSNKKVAEKVEEATEAEEEDVAEESKDDVNLDSTKEDSSEKTTTDENVSENISEEEVPLAGEASPWNPAVVVIILIVVAAVVAGAGITLNRKSR